MHMHMDSSDTIVCIGMHTHVHIHMHTYIPVESSVGTLVPGGLYRYRAQLYPGTLVPEPVHARHICNRRYLPVNLKTICRFSSSRNVCFYLYCYNLVQVLHYKLYQHCAPVQLYNLSNRVCVPRGTQWGYKLYQYPGPVCPPARTGYPVQKYKCTQAGIGVLA